MPSPRLRTAVACAAALWLALPGIAAGAGELLELKWAELRPAAPIAPAKPKTFFSGVPKPGAEPGAEPAPPSLQEGQFMSVKRRQPGAGPPEVVAELNGKRVRIGGYVVPLDFEATRIKEFLLVPYVGACIHVPPPPANQIIYVTSVEPIEIKGLFEPIAVSGTLSTEPAFTGLADTGYRMTAVTVEPWKE